MQPADGDGMDSVARLRYGLPFHLRSRSGKLDLRTRRESLHRIGNRDGGVDVPACSTPGKQYARRVSHPPCYSDCRETLRSVPIIMPVTSIEVPPYDTSGIGRPVTGSSPQDTAACTKAYRVMLVVNPTPMKRPKGSGAYLAIRRNPRNKRATNAPRSASAPIIPYSSAMMAKMKSLYGAGRKSRCTLLPGPTPVSPPIAKAMRACSA